MVDDGLNDVVTDTAASGEVAVSRRPVGLIVGVIAAAVVVAVVVFVICGVTSGFPWSRQSSSATATGIPSAPVTPPATSTGPAPTTGTSSSSLSTEPTQTASSGTSPTAPSITSARFGTLVTQVLPSMAGMAPMTVETVFTGCVFDCDEQGRYLQEHLVATASGEWNGLQLKFFLFDSRKVTQAAGVFLGTESPDYLRVVTERSLERNGVINYYLETASGGESGDEDWRFIENVAVCGTVVAQADVSGQWFSPAARAPYDARQAAWENEFVFGFFPAAVNQAANS